MGNNLYFNLKNTCQRLNNYFRDVEDIEFSASPKLERKSRSKRQVILISLNIRLTDYQVMDAEKIAEEIKESVEREG